MQVNTVRKMIIRGHSRMALEMLIQSLFPDTKMGEMGPSAKIVLERTDMYLSKTNRFSQVMFRFTLMFFDWSAFFYYRLERFSRMHERVRARFISMWMYHKISVFRNMFYFLRVFITVPYYDMAYKLNKNR